MSLTLVLNPPSHTVVFDNEGVPYDLWTAEGSITMDPAPATDTYIQLFRQGLGGNADQLSGIWGIPANVPSTYVQSLSYVGGVGQVYAQKFGDYDPANRSNVVTVDDSLPASIPSAAVAVVKAQPKKTRK